MSNAPSKPVSFSRPKVGYFSNRPRICGVVGGNKWKSEKRNDCKIRRLLDFCWALLDVVLQNLWVCVVTSFL